MLKSYLLAVVLIAVAVGQTPPAPAPAQEPDTLTLKNGEKLIGHLVRSTGATLTFKSDMVGELTLDWSKVQELHSAQRFAVVKKDVKPSKNADAATIPQGAIAATEKEIVVTPGNGTSPQTIPVANSAYVIDQATFDKAVLRKPGWYQGWQGQVTAGASFVEATQNAQTASGALSIARAVPGETWLDRRNRTVINLSAAYGIQSQPNTPSIKTAIFHGDGERDEYFSDRLFGFGAVAYDHSYSQGLNLQQTYGGGVGWTAIKRANQELDLKASVNYLKESFYVSSQDQDLIASTFTETYFRRLPRSIVLNEQLSIVPAWNNTNAYAVNGNLLLTLPVYKRLNITFSAIDGFLNNAPTGSKKNSLQLSTGITYRLQ